jgi:hypothetical protein
VNKEGFPGRKIYLSTSDDAKSWSAPSHFVGKDAVNPIIPFDQPGEKEEMQSQPNLLNLDDQELWCIWSIRGFTDSKKNAGTYLSTLQPGSSRWVNKRIWTESIIDGMRAYAYPSQNPVLLNSGRVIVPVTFDTGVNVKNARYPIMYNAFLYTDDAGETWQCSNMISTPHNLTGQWEPCAHQQADGKVRAFFRNFSSKVVKPDQWLQTTVGRGVNKGEKLVFEPDVKYSFMETANTRMHTIKLSGGRYCLFHHDIYTEARSYGSRFNGAVFFSPTGEDDFVAACGFSEKNQVVAYPQGIEHDKKIYVAYTLGGINVPRSILVAVMDSPDADGLYIYPRDKDVLRADDLTPVRSDPYNYNKRVRDYDYIRPCRDEKDGRNVVVFKQRGTAGVEIQPVRFEKGEKLTVSFDVKIESLQEVGNLIICSFGDQIPIRIGMPSGRAGQLYAYSREQWQRAGDSEIGKWNSLEITFESEVFAIRINNSQSTSFENTIKNPSRRLYLGDGYELDEFESNRGSKFIIDIDSFRTKHE